MKWNKDATAADFKMDVMQHLIANNLIQFQSNNLVGTEITTEADISTWTAYLFDAFYLVPTTSCTIRILNIFAEKSTSSPHSTLYMHDK